MTRFAPLPDPPYYAVIFANQRAGADPGYEVMAEKMAALAAASPGCIGMESTRDAEGFGLTVSYWSDEAAVLAWKADAQHLVAQQLGKTRWYEHYRLRVARVERHYADPKGR
ncbi:antibiotic biosynthesis monooxygenase [Lutimaribacter sp. EGI FJ00015]|uniref:Antibiotic biosynthesis monooxygenase n=1 Tax=Lutimaribacter degradans TaxID=2945989 RepID=A0ACC5ZY25_9RHOB|nr:antibiotic biosynthesis monooxygenase [Lutimaribacter sp. EGI FJ00013]MCM2562449.1 antibiotic biosynthesis monooxygenase [Lutimaribacter sp. EGI FJ00013]MCO0613606.1 antibiotic biosynthesis monooxygenase [Lutimaribacter sp. EGI FJ00015]MCO0636578.1 antibiotic biosynthesis monooxygenase [Lutimaribacter sp. EGI FJ00014]